MGDSSQSPSVRLDRVLFEIVQLTQGRLPPGSLSVAARRANIDRAATLLIELYGDEALERARQIETKSVQPAFARSVRLRVEELRSKANDP
jgi:hypothetical protein